MATTTGVRLVRRAASLLVCVALVTAGFACSGADDDGADPPADSLTEDVEAGPATTAGPLGGSFEVLVESPRGLPGYRLYRPADLDAAERPFPVVVWANGGCVRHDETWAPLLEAWAAAGVVVVAISTPADGPDARTGATSADDQALAIDWLEEVSAEPGVYAGALDLDRIVAAGNSCGGITSVALVSSDDRPAAAFVLSGSGSLPGSTPEEAAAAVAAVDVPVGYAVGGPEDIARANAEQDVAGFAPGVPGYVASRAEGDHVTVSTDPAILEHEVAPIGLRWFQLALYGSEAALDALVDDPCPACPAGTWRAEGQDLESLVGAG